MPYHAGYEEDKFLRSLAPLNITEIELLASNCTEVEDSLCYTQFAFNIYDFYLFQILTWHTQTKKNPVASPLDMHKYNGTNLVNLHKLIV